MDFDYSPRTQELQAQLLRFMDEHIYPNEQRYVAEIEANTKAGKRWTPLQMIEELKPKARAPGPVEPVPAAHRRRQGLEGERPRFGLSNLDYAPLCEIMGRVPWAPRGLQLLGARHRQHGDARALRHAGAQESSGCEPLLDGKIRSAFAMTEPASPRPTRPTSRRASSARATTTSSTAASGGPAAPATRAARSTSSWARPTRTRRATRSSR